MKGRVEGRKTKKQSQFYFRTHFSEATTEQYVTLGLEDKQGQKRKYLTTNIRNKRDGFMLQTSQGASDVDS